MTSPAALPASRYCRRLPRHIGAVAATLPAGWIARCLAFFAALLLAGLPITGEAGAPAAFWQAFAGAWVAEASYLDEKMQPIIARYSTLTQVELVDGGVVVTEWKFYPDGELARGMSGGKLPAGRGLETVTRSPGHADPAQPGAVLFGADRGRWVAATPELATGLIAGKGAAPRYRFIATLTGPDHAEISTWGYHDDGSFKGLALFRMRRIAAADVGARLATLRGQYAVGLTLDSRPR